MRAQRRIYVYVTTVVNFEHAIKVQKPKLHV